MKPLFAFIASSILLSTSVVAATVETRISTREAYVGVPLVLQVNLSNVSDYEPPTLPTIDGCEMRSAGAPSQSSQITIINGRRSESHSITLQYLITPRREGLFTVPAMTLQVDGQAVQTQPQRFVASRSETGDLLFVAVEGSQEKVYVGQPINLTLSIWIKPFRDPKTGHTLSEGDMWNLLADSTSWGGFEAKLKELAQKRQRPGGREVLREDATGQEQVYYLYEIEATIYPKRAGKIDADDVQIVVNYPTQLGESRAPLGGLFDDDIFGKSPLSQMMRDDFFGSAFGKRLAITAARPIVAQASVDATDVLPVPSEGRPSDYRGAVGRYQIVTQARPTSVDAGDPITLNIGIVGTGAMDLVQAPPLAEMPELTADFKVDDESLAGFVQADSKLFTTTIRPRQAGTREIPGIRFSFFDPETETFETVTSQPIPITVQKAEMLALDSIVGPLHNSATGPHSSAQTGLPDFTNYNAPDVLSSHAPLPPSGARWWWLFIIVPPAIWLATVCAKHHRRFGRWLGSRVASLRPAHQHCVARIERASSASAVRDAVVTYILRRFSKGSQAGPHDQGAVHRATLASAVLRTAGLYDLAGETESWLATADRDAAEFSSAAGRSTAEDPLSPSTTQLKSTAIELVGKLESVRTAQQQGPLRVTRSRSKLSRTSPTTGRPHTTLMVLALAAAVPTTGTSLARPAVAQSPVGLAAAAKVAAAAETETETSGPSRTARESHPTGQLVSLTRGQQETLLGEAAAAYARGLHTTSSEPADAKQAFATAAQKYQLLVDSGITNDKLFVNLANAYLQSGSLGRAIASYEKALRINPRNAQGHRNLAFAQAQVGRASNGTNGTDGAASTTARRSPLSLSAVQLPQFKSAVSQWAIPAFCLASLGFWGLLIWRSLDGTAAVGGYAVAALWLMLIAGGVVWWAERGPTPPLAKAVIVADKVILHAGDGEQFGIVATVDQAQGLRVERLNSRGEWTQIQTDAGQVGWIRSRDVEVIS